MILKINGLERKFLKSVVILVPIYRFINKTANFQDDYTCTTYLK